MIDGSNETTKNALLRTAHSANLQPDVDDLRRRVAERHKSHRAWRVTTALVSVAIMIAVAVVVLRPLASLHHTTAPTPPRVRAASRGTIHLGSDGVPEGAVLLMTRAGGEILRSGRTTSELVTPLGLVPYDLSPDGERVVASVEELEPTGEFRETQIVVFDLTTGTRLDLVDAEATESFGVVEWSPDGTLLAYRVSHLRQVVDDLPAQVLTEDVCTISPATRDRRCYTDPESVMTFDWSPDGSHLIIGNDSGGIDVLDLATGVVSPLVSPTEASDALTNAGFDGPYWFTRPVWAPSGDYFAARIDAEGGDTGVAVFDSSGSPLMAKHVGVPDFFRYGWSPTTDRLAYTESSTPITSPDRSWNLHVVSVPSGGETTLLSAEPTFVTGLAWSPTGTWIMVTGGPASPEATAVVVAVDAPSHTITLSLGTYGLSNPLCAWGVNAG